MLQHSSCCRLSAPQPLPRNLIWRGRLFFYSGNMQAPVSEPLFGVMAGIEPAPLTIVAVNAPFTPHYPPPFWQGSPIPKLQAGFLSHVRPLRQVIYRLHAASLRPVQSTTFMLPVKFISKRLMSYFPRRSIHFRPELKYVAESGGYTLKLFFISRILSSVTRAHFSLSCIRYFKLATTLVDLEDTTPRLARLSSDTLRFDNKQCECSDDRSKHSI